MTLGLFGARADKRGLAVMTQDFAEHMKPDRILGIDLSENSPYPSYFAPDVEVVTRDKLTVPFLKDWFSSVDSVWFAETGYTDETFPIARELVWTMLHAMPEFYPWKSPTHVVANPTTWRMAPEMIHFPFPVDTERLPFKLKEKALRFVHVAGHPAAHDRNGMQMVLSACQFLRIPVEVVICSRQPVDLRRFRFPSDLTVTVVDEVEDQLDLYAADVLVLPRRYGGQCLPMNEAMSMGLPVISLDVSPQRDFLHPKGLVPATRQSIYRTQGGKVDSFACDPRLLAKKMLMLYERPELVQEMSLHARAYAESISWDTLKPRFRELLRL